MKTHSLTRNEMINLIASRYNNKEEYIMGLFKKKEKSNDPKFWDTLSGPTKGTVIAAAAVKTAKWLSIGKDILDARNGCDCIEDGIIEDSVADVTETM